VDELDEFYADLQDGIVVREFLERYPLVLDFVHANGLTSSIRLGAGRCKRLRDELSPARRFAQAAAGLNDLIQFPLDSGPIDCNIVTSRRHIRKIQITVAQARERLNLMHELESRGSGRGYLGVTDDAPMAEFEQAIHRPRMMYGVSGAQETLCRAVSLCINRKAEPKGADTLLIDAPLNILPLARIEETMPRLRSCARVSGFRDVFLVGDGEFRQSCFRLK
jgi:hypothetical protein